MRKIRVALIQFDTKPEMHEENLSKMTELIHQAAGQGARWIMFHEETVCDCTPRVRELAEDVPAGPSTQAMIALSKQHDCFISFGLAEVDADRYYITQAFTGPDGFVYRYRKTWLWRQLEDKGYRNEHNRYHPGTGPELFTIDGIHATCFICADGESPLCIEQAAALKPQVVFYPNNRTELHEFELFGGYAKAIDAPMLVTNRIGKSWDYDCEGGCVVYDAKGEVLARANRQGKEEILIHDLEL